MVTTKKKKSNIELAGEDFFNFATEREDVFNIITRVNQYLEKAKLK